jgi:mannitol/fructose-specific phosphotransferase system IIA component (Ntr-type)
VDAASLLEPRAVLVLGGRPDKQELMRLLVERLVELHPDLDGAAILRRLLRREEEASTFLESGVGFPHARIRGLSGPLAAMAVCPEAAGEGSPRVTLLLLLLEERPDQALQLLAAAARVFRSPKSIDTLAHATSAEQVVGAWRALLAASASAATGASRSPGRQEGST